MRPRGSAWAVDGFAEDDDEEDDGDKRLGSTLIA